MPLYLKPLKLFHNRTTYPVDRAGDLLHRTGANGRDFEPVVPDLGTPMVTMAYGLYFPCLWAVTIKLAM